MPSGVYKHKKGKHWKVKDTSNMGIKKGTKLSEEHKRKIKEDNLRNPRRYWLGKKRPPFSQKWRDNIGKGSMGNKSRTGQKQTEEEKKKNSEANTGEKHWNWQGGKSFEPYSIDWTKTLRQSIRERDHYICQLCNKPQQERIHSIHHIDYNKQNCNPENLITLCVSCNAKVNFNREKWIKYFSNK